MNMFCILFDVHLGTVINDAISFDLNCEIGWIIKE